VRLLALKENTGFARGNNLAIEAACVESEWIALINPDAFAEPRWLEALLAARDSNTLFNVFASKLIRADDHNLLDGCGDAYHMTGRVWRVACGYPVSVSANRTHQVFSPCAAAAFYKRSALREVGGFDEDYFCYLEDVDVGFRLRLMGCHCLYVPQSVAYHIGSGTTGGQHSDFALYHGHRNLVWTFVKNMPGVLFWLLLPLHLLLNFFSIFWFALRGRGGVIMRAKRDALLGLPKMWRKRRKIQKNRVVSIAEVWRQLGKWTIQ
jgi:GT2 family glycosyltransferase